MAMRYGLAVFALIALMAPATAQISPDVKSMISAYDVADQECRGSPDADAACGRRTEIGMDLNKAGFCYGKQGQGRASFDWHRCTARSLHARTAQ